MKIHKDCECRLCVFKLFYKRKKILNLSMISYESATIQMDSEIDCIIKA